ncbi:hypothetical protein [Candidatus Contubernalis alkaliaceticus]|uniref:hypothetical protein n=1 Tax=Candidatus Contubernalis alkaliaceticus TaxID=338645 RepID=UPI001F4C0CAC|nr:hypothetical protein [Candidatus Contubernalis alkalaceticus]UNC92627.1 hypothetical protein HUE98_11250 [Candidatus Contubernalis alkalaceticus]
MENSKNQTYKLYGIVLVVILLLSFVFLVVFLTGSSQENDPNQNETVLEHNENEDREGVEEDFVGIYNDKIAIFRGVRPEGTLKEITDYEVKEVYRSDLEKGIPFEDEEEKIRILESYTS